MIMDAQVFPPRAPPLMNSARLSAFFPSSSATAGARPRSASSRNEDAANQLGSLAQRLRLRGAALVLLILLTRWQSRLRYLVRSARRTSRGQCYLRCRIRLLHCFLRNPEAYTAP